MNDQADELLPAPLREILRCELDAGNEVVEVNCGWPDARSVFVLLKLPFRATHHSAHFSEINDRHYWKAEYSCKENGARHILACRF